MSYYRQQLEEYLSKLDVEADLVYDIGGSQGEVKDRVKSWNVKNYKVLDLPKWDVESKNFYTWQNIKKADVVFCLEVFEYLIDPIQSLVNIKRALKEGGRAYITFQFVYPHHNELEMDSLRYTEYGIKRLAKKTGLIIKKIDYRVDKSGVLKSFYSIDGMRSAKQYANHDVTGFIVEFTK